MKLRFLLSIGCIASILSVATAADNSVLYWNQQAIDSTRLSRNPPPMAAVLFATFHAAIFDALNGIDHRYHGWLVNDPAPAGADPDAAVAGAAHAVQLAVWSQTTNPRNFEIAYQRALAGIPDGAGKTAGIAWGEHVAARVLAWLAKSGYDKPIPGTYSSDEPGKWRETPSQFRPALLPYWGHVTPFVMRSADQFRAPPPESLGSQAYAEELAFVSRTGRRDNAERTEYQTLSTPFWNDDLGTSTPPGHWNMIAQDIARRRRLAPLECARLFALLNLAEADAGISCWETKYYYTTWRPETALREMNGTLNPHVKTDPGFIPNMPSPPFPSYTSGHSTFSAAGTRIMERFFGTDDIAFSVTSDALPGAVRTYQSLSAARDEAGMSRVWGGIHTMSDNIEAQKVGRKVADWVFDHALAPARIASN